MTARLNCVDMSRHGGPLTPAEAACMRAQGIQKVIVGTGRDAPGALGQHSRQQAASAIGAGMDLDAYVYLYMSGSPEGQVEAGLQTMRGIPVEYWWLDAEDTQSPQLSVGQRTTFLNRCIAYLNNHGITRVGIYTGSWWWKPTMQNSQTFKHLPLWNSFYDQNPDTDGLPYGGWVDSFIEQYTGTVTVCGQSVDSNYAKQYDEEADMDPQLEEMIWRMSDILVGEPPADSANANGDRLTALRAEWARKAPMVDAVRNDQTALSGHIDNHPGATTVAEHEHGGVKR